MVRFWDERYPSKCVRSFHNTLGEFNGSPVYSLARTNNSLFIGLSTYVVKYDFDHGSMLPQSDIDARVREVNEYRNVASFM